MTEVRRLFLLRHAKSSWDDSSVLDIDRPLSGRGRRSASTIGSYLEQRGYDPALILCSAARRTRETLGRLLPYLPGDRDIRILEALYRVADAGDLLELVRFEGGGARSVMVIGHNPVLEDLTIRLVASDSSGRLSEAREKFPTGALAVLDAEIRDWTRLSPGDADLHDFMVPRDLDDGA